MGNKSFATGKRKCKINLNLSIEEKKIFEEYAKKCNLSVSPMLRKLVLDKSSKGELI